MPRTSTPTLPTHHGWTNYPTSRMFDYLTERVPGYVKNQAEQARAASLREPVQDRPQAVQFGLADSLREHATASTELDEFGLLEWVLDEIDWELVAANVLLEDDRRPCAR